MPAPMKKTSNLKKGVVQTMVSFPAEIRRRLEEKVERMYCQTLSGVVVNMVVDALNKEEVK